MCKVDTVPLSAIQLVFAVFFQCSSTLIIPLTCSSLLQIQNFLHACDLFSTVNSLNSNDYLSNHDSKALCKSRAAFVYLCMSFLVVTCKRVSLVMGNISSSLPLLSDTGESVPVC